MPLTKDHYRMEGRTEMHNSQDLQKVLEIRDAILGGSEKPVSYTHLDVYKRQAMPCPVRSWGRWRARFWRARFFVDKR